MDTILIPHLLSVLKCCLNQRFLHLIIAVQKKISNVHRDNAFVITAGKFIGSKNIFRIIVLYAKKTFVFSLCGFFITNLLCYLNIKLVVLRI